MELFLDLGLREISSIINVMGVTTEIDQLHADNLEHNGVLYSYDKNGNNVEISDSLGNKTKISINCRTGEEENPFTHALEMHDYHDIAIEYLLKDGSKITLEKTVGLNPGYESFENVRRHDLLHDLKTCYVDKEGKEVASFNLSLDTICLKDPIEKVDFTKDGIKCGNKIVSLEGNSLLSLNGEEIPNKNIFESFNIKEEQEKIKRIIDENKDLHPFTMEVLEDASRKLDRKERYVKDILDFYDKDINNIRKAIDTKNKIEENVKHGIVNKEGLDLVANDFYLRTRTQLYTLKK